MQIVFKLIIALSFPIAGQAQQNRIGLPIVTPDPTRPNSRMSDILGASDDLFDIRSGAIIQQSSGDNSAYPWRDAFGGSSGSNESGTAIVDSNSSVKLKA